MQIYSYLQILFAISGVVRYEKTKIQQNYNTCAQFMVINDNELMLSIPKLTNLFLCFIK